MLGPLLLLQLATASSGARAYQSAALESFIAAAATENLHPPPGFQGYRAHVESELSLILRDTLGRENVAQVEEVASRVEWRPDVRYELRVVGYRSASVGVPYSALSFARSWTVPSLYGDRLALGVDLVRSGAKPTKSDERNPARADSVRASANATLAQAVHPLAADRARYYRFSGGDTVAFIRSGARVVPIARVRVTPMLQSIPSGASITVFDGEIDFDATRHQIVRMRGRFVTRTASRSGLRSRVATLAGVVGVAFVEFVNAEVDGRYWLPQFQRTEFQASVALLGGQRSVFRLISRFSDLAVERAPPDDSSLISTTPAVDTTPATRRTLSFAREDSISRYHGWLRPLGAATAEVNGSDFDDYLPDAWRPYGPPRWEFAPREFDEVFRFDRVEGAYTGAAAALRFRDAAPGLSIRGFGGWAWSEQTPRGGGSVEYTRQATTVAARIERKLVSTNDFAAPLDAGTIGFSGLLGADDQDYLDRLDATATLMRSVASARTAIVTIAAGLGEDRNEVARMSHGPFGAGEFRINRASDNGRYFRGAATLELHPDVTGLFLEPGAGLVASYEIGRGQLDWQRAELTLSARRGVGELTVTGRARGGIVLGSDIPPQQLFELGGEGALPGYAYKQFAGDRAAVAGVLASYTLPLFRRPMRIVRSLVVPGFSPGLDLGIQSGWAEASSEGVLESIRKLDPLAPAACVDAPTVGCPAALSTPSGGVRATVDARVTLFGGLLGFGVARAIDRAVPWRLVFRFGQEY